MLHFYHPCNQHTDEMKGVIQLREVLVPLVGLWFQVHGPGMYVIS